jgi:hypothetical protein
MPDVNLLAVLAATVAAFICGGAYYAVVGAQPASANEPMPPWKLAAVHGGDWLAKLLLVAVIVTVWQ